MYYLCNMEWLNSLFFEHTPLQAVVILSIIIAVGLGLGKIHLFGISLGVTFVFFSGPEYAELRREFRSCAFCI